MKKNPGRAQKRAFQHSETNKYGTPKKHGNLNRKSTHILRTKDGMNEGARAHIKQVIGLFKQKGSTKKEEEDNA